MKDNLPFGSFKLSDNLLLISPAAMKIGSVRALLIVALLESVDSILIIEIVSGAANAASRLLKLLLLLPAQPNELRERNSGYCNVSSSSSWDQQSMSGIPPEPAPDPVNDPGV